MQQKTNVDVILVPRGAEYRAVRRGLAVCDEPPPLCALPIGPGPVRRFLYQWYPDQAQRQTVKSVLLMGVCGGLTPQYPVAQGVLYERCFDGAALGDERVCDAELSHQVGRRLGSGVVRVQGLSCDRILCTVAEKQQWAQMSAADVVDMEGFAALDCLQQWQIRVAMVRVVSDDGHHPLPDLSAALAPDGTLRSFPLAVQMLRQPRRSLRLIRGSLQALHQLQRLTAQLFAPVPQR